MQPDSTAHLPLDALTGVLIRQAMVAQVQLLIDRHGVDSIYALVVEISRFGTVNDSIGSDLGDRILSMVTKRVLKTFPNALAVGRMHGDHIALCFTKEASREEVIARLFDFTQRPFAVSGEIVVLSIRVGIADETSQATDAKSLLHAAEVALHQAKAQRVKVLVFDPSMREQARKRFEVENDLRTSLVVNAAALHSALANQEFVLHYQPIVETHSGCILAFEALLRWNHPTKGLIAPGVFIPTAEEIRIMDVLGSWVLRRACKEAASWPLRRGCARPAVSVNVSATQFLEPRLLIDSVKRALDESGLPARQLHLEVTESSAPPPGLWEALHELSRLGCRISMDDFGTGYSSLTQIHAMPLNILKVDRSFILGLSSDNPETAQQFITLVRSVVAVAEVFNLIVIAEGVETERQLQILESIGIHRIQGYFFSRPMPDNKVATFIEEFADPLNPRIKHAGVHLDANRDLANQHSRNFRIAP